MATNPNPARITSASWRFMEALLALVSGTENSGIYGNKPGYHGTRAENDARTGTGTRDYSCRAPLDRLGPSDKAAGYDWTFHSAQAGDYRQMAVIGDRLEAAFNARDPRLYGWREALGQTDTDAPPEGLDFQGWFTRVPTSSHSWHWHLSEIRAFVESWDNKLCMLSVIKGETLAAYLAAGGVLMKGAVVADVFTQDDRNVAWATTSRTMALLLGKDARYKISGEAEFRVEVNAIQPALVAISAQSAANGSALSALTSAVGSLTNKVDALADMPVTMTPEDQEAIATLVAAKVLAGLTALQFVGQPATPTV